MWFGALLPWRVLTLRHGQFSIVVRLASEARSTELVGVA